MKPTLISLFFLIISGGGASSQGLSAFMAGPASEFQKADTLLKLSPFYFLKARFDSVDYCIKEGLPLAKKAGDASQLGAYYLLIANMNTMRGKPRQALQDTYIAGPYITEKASYELRVRFYMARANCFNLLSMLDSALYYFQLTEHYNAEKLPYANWAVYLAMGQAYVHADDFVNAENYFKKAYDITKGKPISPENGYVLNLTMNMYTSWNKPEQAGQLLEAYNRMMVERKKAKLEDPLQNLL
jgi:tetratricopeptide (TPR) repeat protein